MNPIVFALRHPVTVMVGVVAVLIGSYVAVDRMKADVFPPLNQPVIYVCQPYAGMNPNQMEGLLTTYYEYHFIYLSGIHHVESRNVQGMALMKLYFHPGTDMAQALSETVAQVNRSRAFMPPGTVPPFVTRVDTGTAGIGYFVLSSETRSIKEIQDLATMRVRPMFASVPGMSAPPAFGGNQRSVVVTVDPDKLRAQGLTLDQVTEAVNAGNAVTPSGNLRIGDRMFLVDTNVMVGAEPAKELALVPLKTGEHPVLLRDVATIADTADITAGYVLVNGKRSVYMLVTKRPDASTITVVNGLKARLPAMRESVPEDVGIDFVFDQSTIVSHGIRGVVTEGLVGALLTGLMVVVFLRDWRSVIVVVLNIPLALAAAVFALWATGQTINLMTLGGLALAVGILVDEATVEVENIHTQMHRYPGIARAVRAGNQETAVPRLLAMLCILAVFIPSFFMEGAARELFVPLSLAVGFAMIASYILSSTFVPVLSVWLLQRHPAADHPERSRLRSAYEGVLARVVYFRWFLVPVYLAVGIGGAVLLYTSLGTAVFPPAGTGQFLLRIKAPTGTRIERTEDLAREATRLIREELGAGNVGMTVGYVGMFPSTYPVQGVYQWTSGPQEVLLRVALNPESGLRADDQKERLRAKLGDGLRAWLAARWKEDGLTKSEIDDRLPGLRLSFEPGDLVSDVMSFGSPTPVEIHVHSPNMASNREFAEKVRRQLEGIPELRDVQVNPAADYPTIDINVDRVKAATVGLTARGVGQALIPATASSRFMNPGFWRDPTSGQAYIVQVQVAPPAMSSTTEIGLIPVRSGGFGLNGHGTGYGSGMAGMSGAAAGGTVYLRDVATIRETTTPEEVYRYNMRRTVSITANVHTADLGRVRRQVVDAIAAVGEPPRGVQVDVRGQLNTLHLVERSLTRGLLFAVLSIALLLTAYFQSVRLALVSVAGVPATLCGVGLTLLATGTTLNLQSFMGAIMALGVSVANAILLVTFAERSRVRHGGAVRGAVEGGLGRLRAILMTSCAMVAGMVPMAVGWGSSGEQTAPLGRAVVGGLVASTLATLFVLPAVFALVQGRAGVTAASLDPDDPQSRHHDEDKVRLFEEGQ